MSYRAYFDDGTFSDDEVVQPYRVICIVQPNASTGRDVLQSYPYYMLKDGVWRGVEDLPSLVQQVIYFVSQIEAVAMGIWTDQENYAAIKKRAFEDPDFPRRSSNNPDHRR